MKMFKRNDTTGVWDVEVLVEPLPAIQPPWLSASFDSLEHIPHQKVAELTRSFVEIKFSAPVFADGQLSRVKLGMGLVVDAERGHVIVSRTVVPTKLCDIELTFAKSVLVPGKVVFLHPSQHYAIIQYNPSLLDGTVKSAKFSTERVKQGVSTLFIGHTYAGEMVYAPTAVTKVIPLEREPPNPPRGRPIDVDGIDIETRIGNHCSSGVLAGEDGVIQALWIAYEEDLKEACFGLSSHVIAPVTEKLRQGTVPRPRSLCVEFGAINMIEARVMGVSEEWVGQVQSKPENRRLFMVKRGSSQLPDRLYKGDVLLTLDGKLVTQLSDMEVVYWKESLEVVAVRSGEQISFTAQTVSEDEFETSHVVNFCGLTAQKPHRTVRQCIRELPSEVYIVSLMIGSPAHLYKVNCSTFITHIDNNPTPNLESLIKVVAKIPDKTCEKDSQVLIYG